MAYREEAKERFLQHIGSVIRSYRHRNGIDRHTLASALGCDDSTLSRYEHGKSDIKASTMAYASILCDFPMYKYTEIYNREPAAIVDDFKKLVMISVPIKRRKHRDISNRPPKPRLVFDEKAGEWIMKETTPIEEPDVISVDVFPDENADTFFIDYITNRLDQGKSMLLSQLLDLVNAETANGTKKCPKELKNLIRSSLKYVISDKDKGLAARLTAYYDILSNLYSE